MKNVNDLGSSPDKLLKPLELVKQLFLNIMMIY